MAFKDIQTLKSNMFIENLKDNRIINEGVYMFNLPNTNYNSSTDTEYKNGFVLGMDEITDIIKTEMNTKDEVESKIK